MVSLLKMSFLGDLITEERSGQHWHSSAFLRTGTHIAEVLNHTLLIKYKGKNTEHTHCEQVQADLVCGPARFETLVQFQISLFFFFFFDLRAQSMKTTSHFLLCLYEWDKQPVLM